MKACFYLLVLSVLICSAVNATKLKKSTTQDSLTITIPGNKYLIVNADTISSNQQRIIVYDKAAKKSVNFIGTGYLGHQTFETPKEGSTFVVTVRNSKNGRTWTESKVKSSGHALAPEISSYRVSVFAKDSTGVPSNTNYDTIVNFMYSLD